MKWIRVDDFIYNANEVECFMLDETDLHVSTKTYKDAVYTDLTKEMFDDFIYWMNRCEDEVFDVNKCIELIRSRSEHIKKIRQKMEEEKKELKSKKQAKCICEDCHGKREVDTED